MIVLVTGGRDYLDVERVCATLDDLHAESPVGLLIHGGARGADTLAAQWATGRGIHTAEVKALWGVRGSKAGPLRNVAMVKMAAFLASGGASVVVVAFRGGAGTNHCKQTARAHGLTVLEVE